ncbi:response regulator transcription factor [Sulfurimonas autotrophica]|uniref:Two component transcriptional regulator, winged helix family n=1 Tax=Sulfurimonas autotrophica (strain ATCC BAA-671 / DSM 16294 / JCM 11897 / OK10) TaxID=563040 RepID=E0URW1_SULAO|nr:response regulator transcription factor [Sulfurimonas autotrophica]ADN10125.1 two component transcriptional regulator, winged helix family [Sulfurimonas autotrophica DSM 16294]
MNILLMEDDPVLSDILLDFLREEWDVDYAYSSQEVYERLESSNYDLFIFDINVMGKNGVELLKELRKFSNNTPAIFITAYRDTEHLQRAFDAGAHDYIKKPFELEELHARILSIKRVFNIETNEYIPIGDKIVFYPMQRTVHVNNNQVSLTAKDAMLLSYFLKNKARLISSEELSQNIWDFDSLPSDATLRSHIRTLREIIGKEKIKTIRGEGYMYE